MRFVPSKRDQAAAVLLDQLAGAIERGGAHRDAAGIPRP